MLNGVDQNMINTVVDGVLSNTLTLEQETEYINLSTPYDDLYNENNFNMHNWIQNGDQFPINDLCDWDSYLDEGWLLDSGFTESRLSHWSLGKMPTIDEYKKFLRVWITHTFEHFDYSIFPIASIHNLQHDDGRKCVCLLASTEGGQGGWEFEDVYEGLFPNQDDAVSLLKENGIIHSHSDAELSDFIERVVSELKPET